MITIRPEREEDYTVIHEINILAFGQENEARLVKKIREAADFIPELSLVAIKNGRVVGHILFSRITIQSKTGSFPHSPLHPWPFIRNSKTRALALNLCGRGWNAAEIKVIKLSLQWATPNSIPVLDSPLRERKGLKLHSSFQMRSLWFSSLAPVPCMALQEWSSILRNS
jgi:putative acetyltransferase